MWTQHGLPGQYLGSGFAVGGAAGDVNADGFNDVVVGAQFFDNPEWNEGKVFVYHGSPAGLSTSSVWTAESDQPNAWFGFAVAGAGDVNGDGYSDLIVGAPGYDSGLGGAFVSPGSNVGWAVGSAGDLNSDGYSEVSPVVLTPTDGAVVSSTSTSPLKGARFLLRHGTSRPASWPSGSPLSVNPALKRSARVRCRLGPDDTQSRLGPGPAV